MIEGHGDDLYRYGCRIRYNFSSNIFQDIDHSGLYGHLATRLNVISNYPEPAPYSVETLLSEWLGLPSDNILVTNGAVDAIHLLARYSATNQVARASCQSSHQHTCSAILQPTFAEYADACRLSGHEVVSFTDINDIPLYASVIWICNPNNPTGSVFDPQRLLSLANANMNRLIVIDQAYHKYTRSEVLSPSSVLEHPNLILLYSLTKDYAIPGLRLGYIVADKLFIEALRPYRTPWSVNALAIEAAKYLLGRDTGRVGGYAGWSSTQSLCSAKNPVLRGPLLGRLMEEVERVTAALVGMGVVVHPTETNFMLCQLPKGTAADLKEYLAVENGILIRDSSNFVGLSPGHFRIAVQTPEANDALIDALRLWISR